MSEVNKIINGINAKVIECTNAQLSDMAIQAHDLKDNKREIKMTSQEIIEKIKNAKTMPNLNQLRTEIVSIICSGSEEDFHKIQDAFRKAKNKLKRIPLKERTW